MNTPQIPSVKSATDTETANATANKNGSVLKSSSNHDIKSSRTHVLTYSSTPVLKYSRNHVSRDPVRTDASTHVTLRALGERCACPKKGNERRSRFELAREVRAFAQCLGRQLSFGEQVTAFNGWYEKGKPNMTTDYDNQLALFLREQASVKKPKGGDVEFRRMVLTVAKLPVSELPVISAFEGEAPETWRRVAALHREKARQAKGGVYELSSRDTANALEGWDHQAAHALNDVLAEAGVIKKAENGAAGKQRGKATKWRYLLPLEGNGEKAADAAADDEHDLPY
jgi:hypothetical protein